METPSPAKKYQETFELIMADQDKVVPVDQALTWAKQLTKPPQLEIFPGTGHFFHGRLLELREKLKGYLACFASE